MWLWGWKECIFLTILECMRHIRRALPQRKALYIFVSFRMYLPFMYLHMHLEQITFILQKMIPQGEQGVF